MDMDAPSMVQRSGDTLIVRSVVSGDQLYLDQQTGNVLKTTSAQLLEGLRSSLNLIPNPDIKDELESQIEPKDEGLPQCKIKRNYSCNTCTFFTQNPRYFLTHLREIHGEKIVINECKLCLYASRHYQKLVRHMKMVHGSTEGIEEHAQARKRQLGREGRKRKCDDNHQVSNNISVHHNQQHQQQQQQQHHHPQFPLHQAIMPVNKIDDIIDEEPPQNRLLKCSVCDFTTLYRAQLVDHEQDEHYKTKFFRCEKCSYVTHIKARFSKHVKYHSMPMIKCVTCDFRTPYKWNLDRHMKNHGGSGTFKCAACNFTADIKQSLTVHEMNHHVPPVGHAAGMSMARRRNKVGGTDITEDFLSENGDLSDSYNNNNNNDDFDEPYEKKCKYDDDDLPTDLSQKPSNDSGSNSKKPVRPVPNLIPIQTAGNALNLSKSCSLKDFASLFFSQDKSGSVGIKTEKIDIPQLSPSSNCSSASRKKNGNFFDRLKETLAAGAGHNENLICDCGYISKCLSESIIHQKSCRKYENDEKHSSPSPINLSANSGSTRCQYCRHRCKSSADLLLHLQNCAVAARSNDFIDSASDNNDKMDEHDDLGGDDQLLEGQESRHPMENRVFVWNKMPDGQSDDRSLMDQDFGDQNDDNKSTNNTFKSDEGHIDSKQKANNENSYYGVETAPGYGEVTKKMTPEEEAANSSLKKVYKCPHCSFWASTASRFHVHIVGHLNKKPFECSLCAYRSNWRWDITKHIRLKTIRDPSHKNARVLMNDETGRRNYTKYNKYITLMKVTEEDGDPKLMKSGEMTPNQEASLAFLNDYSGMQKIKQKDDNFSNDGNRQTDPSSGGITKNLPGLDASRLMKIPFFANAVLGAAVAQQQQQEKIKRSPPPLLKSHDELLTQNIDVKEDGSEKKTLYKCRKCNFRHSSREMVLSHVKGHYEEAGINLTHKPNSQSPGPVTINPNIHMKNIIAAMCLSQQQSLTLNDITTTSHQFPIIPIQGPIVQTTNPSQQSPLPLNNNNNNNHNINNNNNNGVNVAIQHHNFGTATATNEHGEADEASSGVVTTTGTGTGVTGWRGPAPYRCGHCHQVSNWKHVIQRHCRLKHNGDIRIETIDRNSDKNSPVYHLLASQSTNTGTNNVLSNNITNSLSNIVGSSNNETLVNQLQNTLPASTTSSSNIEFQTDDNMLQKKNNPTTNSLHTFPNILQQKLTSSNSGLKPKQQKCPSCPFVSESKSQMTYHTSLHKCKSELFQCQLCNYACSKKQLLVQHLKTNHEKPDTTTSGTGENSITNLEDTEAIDLRSKDLNTRDNITGKAISFCQYCPARFIGDKDLKLHIKVHELQFPYRCKICTYTARQEPYLLSHASVHTTPYNEKSKELRKKFNEDSEYPCPVLVQVSQSNGDTIWIVEKTDNHHKSDLDADGNSVRINSEENKKSNNFVPGEMSLLKQQLEAGEQIPINNNNNNNNTNNNNNKNKCNENNLSNEDVLQKCPHCPYDTWSASNFKYHLQNHKIVSGYENLVNCDHCDYSVADEKVLKEHLKYHFQSIKSNKTVAFYTSYDSLELNLSDGPSTSDNSSRLLYPPSNQSDKEIKEDDSSPTSNKDSTDSGSSNMNCKTIVDVTTGEVINRSTSC